MNDIRKTTTANLIAFLEDIGEKKFRAKQIEEWLWQKGASTFDEMSNLSVRLRESLKQNFEFTHTEIDIAEQSSDGTIKFIFKLYDNQKIEGVLIPTPKRVTACISSQVGCPLRCAFCATGQMGFIRNLHYSEIFDQYMLMNRVAEDSFGKGITNIVYMGMGEPLLNYDNVLKSINLLISPNGRGLSAQRITLSTVGVLDGIKRLADENFPCGLAISLHCADATKRMKIIPSTKTYALPKIREALTYFHQKTGERISIEYLLIDGITDTLADAENLWQFCKPFPTKINLIEYNDNDLEFRKSSEQQTRRFVEFLESKNMVVTIRHSRGKEIAAACGQLLVNQKKNLLRKD
ncbi:MAG: 23S rRNA (adenine(2503)-C(2))-methyltransferase RlmN [Bacteroidales bacterium]|nr:23S rRNA (adenine(2503)-C(2))-methyltransferase RlmN [Bacteroidales bacterium]